MKNEDKIQMKDLTPEKRTIIESKLRKEGIVPNICEAPNGYATMIIPADENTKLSGAAAALIPFQDNQSEYDRLLAANLCANQVLNIALTLQRMTEEACSQMDECKIVANSMLQRALSYHISNIKLTIEGIALHSDNVIHLVNENYKAIPLTRSVYEILVTFFGLFILNKSEEERIVAFNCWKINSEKNALGDLDLSDTRIVDRQNQARQNIENCKRIIFSTHLGQELHNELNSVLSYKLPKLGTEFFSIENGQRKIKHLSFSSAWKYMSRNDANYEFQYRLLSMHSHPIHWGLSMFANQNEESLSDAILGLHFSSSFMAKLLSYYKSYFDFEDLDSKLTEHQLGILKSISEAI